MSSVVRTLALVAVLTAAAGCAPLHHHREAPRASVQLAPPPPGEARVPGEADRPDPSPSESHQEGHGGTMGHHRSAWAWAMGAAMAVMMGLVLLL
ncbi:MAG: hypothetical protein SCH98_16850 [Deferrisomatales bacterium]|nr:hypothetical protein [Deferrisomatales bacterium]